MSIASPTEAIPLDLGAPFGTEPRAGHSKPRYPRPRAGGTLPLPEAAEGLSVAPTRSQRPSRVGGPPSLPPSLPAGFGAPGWRV
jgi:hypothetical protein